MVFRHWLWAGGVLLAGVLAGSSVGAATRCAKDDGWCRALVQKAKNLKSRDPAAEARLAMDRGDFRLGRDFYFGDPVIGAASGLPGVSCVFWPQSMIGKEHTHQDFIPAGGREHTAAAGAFLKTYNQTVVGDPRFPYPDICAVTGQKPVAVYAESVTTVSQAVRSGDVAKLKDLNATSEAVNATDEMSMRPLDWALFRKDLDMTAALIELGADPRASDADEVTPLGLAILKGRYDLAKAWRLKGGRLPGPTGLCPRPERFRGPMFLDPPVAQVRPADPDQVGEVGPCTWAGLLLQRGQLDLLDTLMETRTAADAGLPQGLDGESDIYIAFRRAILDHDDALARRLFRYAGAVSADYPGEFIGWLYRHRQYDLMKDRMLSAYMSAAHSDTEAELWRVALESGRYSAFALLFDYGQSVNRLSKAQLAICRAAVTGDKDSAIFDTCIRAAFERSDVIIEAIKAGDTVGVKALIADTASVREDHKLRLDTWVAAYGTPDMLGILTQAGMTPAAGYFYQRYPFAAQVYDGTGQVDYDAYAAPRLMVNDERLRGNEVVASAYRRGDDAMLMAALDAGYTGLSTAMNADIGVGNGLEKYIPDFSSLFVIQVDSEVYPNRPADPALMARLQRDIPRVVRFEGAQALEPLFGYVTHLGWNDVAQMIINSGFDVGKIKNPGEFWFYFALWDSVCKPSTAHLLIKAGLPVRYTRDGVPGTATLLNDLASTCRDGKTIGVVIREGGLDANESIDRGGRTALDEATRRHYEETVKTLVALGGQSGKVVHADIRQTRAAAMAGEGFDPDLWQGPDE